MFELICIWRPLKARARACTLKRNRNSPEWWLRIWSPRVRDAEFRGDRQDAPQTYRIPPPRAHIKRMLAFIERYYTAFWTCRCGYMHVCERVCSYVCARANDVLITSRALGTQFAFFFDCLFDASERGISIYIVVM